MKTCQAFMSGENINNKVRHNDKSFKWRHQRDVQISSGLKVVPLIDLVPFLTKISRKGL
jgi:hypothetical protein